MGALLTAAVLVWLAIPPSFAGDMGRGYEAYDGGDYAAAIAAWRRAADAGNTDAMTAIASLYMSGEGVRRDAARAAAWYRRAAERGDAVAQLNLGDMLVRGVGLGRDRVEGTMWLGLAARQGQQWAANRLRQIEASMPAAEIATARARMARWKPR